MASLCEATLEPCLKRMFIARSAWVQDNAGMKKNHTHHIPFAQVLPFRHSGAWLVHWAACSLLALCAMTWHSSSAASEKGDHERALQALQSGQVLPLTKVLALVEKTHPGQAMEVELESEGGQWQYEIKLLQPNGRLMKLKVDARTGEVLKRKTR